MWIDWNINKSPLSIIELINKTTSKRITKAHKDIRIESYTQEFVIKRLPLVNRVINFFTRNPVQVLFVKLNVKTINIKNNSSRKVILLFPYRPEMEVIGLGSILDLPIKVYSSTEDFMYRFAYDLNKSHNLYIDDTLKIKLDIALSIKPTKVYHDAALDKHIYHVLINIDKLKVKV